MRRLTLFSFLAFLVLLFLLPFLFSQIFAGSLAKLHLGPNTALILILGIVFGGLVNIPIGRVRHEGEFIEDPFAIYGLSGFLRSVRHRTETIIAVNLGGCIIPVGIAVYELLLLNRIGPQALTAAGIAAAINTFVCYLVARPVRGIGIMIPGFVPPVVAALSAYVLAPEHAPPVAFIAGVAGPLIGADFFHLRAFTSQGAGIASIGGAGTFDGIVLSGIVAAYLA